MSSPKQLVFDSCTVPIRDIIQDPTLQVRKTLDQGFIRRYADAYKSGAELPPITLALVGGALYLLDGWHRLEALRSNGAINVSAEVAQTDWGTATWLAARANLGNGLPLKRPDFRRVFRAYIRGQQHRQGAHCIKSYREIAKELGFAPHTTIRNWMQKDFPKLAARMGGAEGGNHEAGPPRADLVGLRMAGIEAGLSQAAANYHALEDAEARGQAIRNFEKTLGDMKSRPYKELQLDDLTDF